MGGNRIDVFVVGGDFALWHLWFDGAWHDWESFGGRIAALTEIAATAWAPGRFDILVEGRDTNLWHTWFD